MERSSAGCLHGGPCAALLPYSIVVNLRTIEQSPGIRAHAPVAGAPDPPGAAATAIPAEPARRSPGASRETTPRNLAIHRGQAARLRTRLRFAGHPGANQVGGGQAARCQRGRHDSALPARATRRREPARRARKRHPPANYYPEIDAMGKRHGSSASRTRGSGKDESGEGEAATVRTSPAAASVQLRGCHSAGTEWRGSIV